MPVFRVNPKTLASYIDAIAKTYRNEKGRQWTSNILPSHDVRSITVRAFDRHGQTDHKCWASFEIKELAGDSELSASICTKAHQSVKLREQVLRQLNQMYPAEGVDDNVHSQKDVDSIMSGWLLDEAAVSGESRPVVPNAADAPTEAEPAAPTAPQHAQVPAAPPETLEAALGRIAQLERGLTETNSAVRLVHQEMQRMTGQVQLVSNRVEGILLNLKATLGYRAQNIYVCASCHAKGEVAARVKCTNCAQENWWGWWPSANSQDEGDSIDWLRERLR